jgi:hypothetical protein
METRLMSHQNGPAGQPWMGAALAKRLMRHRRPRLGGRGGSRVAPRFAVRFSTALIQPLAAQKGSVIKSGAIQITGRK